LFVPEISTTKPTASTASVKSALLRYRVLAWITGLWLLLLVAELTLKYGFDVDALDFVPIVHGWVYFVYLIMAVDLAIKVRWSAGKIIWTALAGTIPFLSFVVEHQRTKEVKAQFGI
jgi:integral membrane protein